MSVAATFDGKNRGTIATNNGWSEFTSWLDSLDEDDYESLRHLAHHGWIEGLEQTRDELQGALASEAGITASDRSVGDELLKLIEEAIERGDDVLVVH